VVGGRGGKETSESEIHTSYKCTVTSHWATIAAFLHTPEKEILGLKTEREYKNHIFNILLILSQFYCSVRHGFEKYKQSVEVLHVRCHKLLKGSLKAQSKRLRQCQLKQKWHRTTPF
jgi:hypothetical protein